MEVQLPYWTYQLIEIVLNRNHVKTPMVRQAHHKWFDPFDILPSTRLGTSRASKLTTRGLTVGQRYSWSRQI